MHQSTSPMKPIDPQLWLKSLQHLPDAELHRLLLMARAAAAGENPWVPIPGRQQQALDSDADILFYGGAAGGGKTDLLLGCAGTQHVRSIIFRREFTQLSAVIDRSEEIYSRHGKYNGSKYFWRLRTGRKNRKLEFGSCQHDGDEAKHQGKARDFIGFDELPHFTEKMFRTLIGWLRSSDPEQRCRVIGAGNPPLNPEEEWVVQFFAPWLDPTHPNPAAPGELRYFATINGKDEEVPDKRAFVLVDGERVYDFNPDNFRPTQIIKPLSRTFIPASVEDNPYYLASGYMAVLQSMPEPLRSKLLYGSFTAGKEDHPWQVIPTEWVRLAQERWKARTKPDVPLSALGADIARGGKDKTVLTPRYDNWFDYAVCHPGKSTPDGRAAAQYIYEEVKNYPNAVVNIDVIGVGSSAYDYTKDIHPKTVPMNASEGSDKRDKSGNLGFANQRAEWYWLLREALDPLSGMDICLPPDRELLVDLCAPRWKLTSKGILVEPKEDIITRIGRSPDKGDSCVYAHAIKHIPGTGLLEFMAAEAEKVAEQQRKAKDNAEAN